MTKSEPNEPKRHYLEQELRQRISDDPDFFNFIQSGSLDGVWYWDLENPDVEWMSPEFWTTLGFDPADKAHSPSEWQDLIHPEDRDLALANFQAHCQDPSVPYDQIVRYTHRDGSTVWIRCRGLALRNAEGQPIRMFGAHTDLTAFKRSEEALQKHEALGRVALNESGVGFIIFDLENEVHFFSDEFYRMLGLESLGSKVAAPDLRDWIHPDDREAVERSFMDLLQGPHTSAEQEYRLKHSDGHYLHLQARGRVLEFSANQRPKTLVATQVDVTSLKKTEQTLAQRDHLWRIALQGSGVGMIELNLQTLEIYLSDEWHRILGLSHSVTSLDEVFALMHPEDVSTAQRDLGGLQSGEVSAANSTLRMRHSDGRYLFFQSYAHIYEWDAAGQPLKLAATQIDISPLKHKEAELSRTSELLESSSRMTQTGWWLVDLEENRVHWSKVTREIHEVDDDFVPNVEAGINFYKAGENREKITREFEKSLAEGCELAGEFEIVTAKGNPKWIKTLGQVEMQNGRAVKIFGSFQDITEQKQNEQDLLEAKAKAEAANRAKSEFLANMSHEIRTPLNGVIGFNELLQRSPLNQTQQSYLKAASESAKSLLDVLNDVLDYSKLEAGQYRSHSEKINLCDWVQHLSDSFMLRTHEKKLEFLLKTGADLPQYIWSDPKLLEQCIGILMNNAIKFTAQGEVELSIERTGPQKICISVRDTGVGIAPEHRSKIFELFSQADGSSTRRYGGTGLGLNICSRLLKLLDTQLELQSQVDVGSEFRFELEVPCEGQFKPSIPGDYSHLQQVLIIDDNDKNRRILEDMLALYGIASTSCKNGIEGLKQLMEERYDLAIIDYQMPLLNGLEVIEKIRRKLSLSDAELPILLLHSSMENHLIRPACQQFNINFEDMKPLTLTRLQEVLSQVPKTEGTALPQPTQHSIQPMVLIVDDNDINRMLASTLIQMSLPNAQIIEAQNGLEAVEMYSRHQVDLVLMDIQMPLQNGYEATREIRRLHPERNTAIIALTAGTEAGERERCLDAGMNEYMSKPIVPELLIQQIQKWLPQFESKQPPASPSPLPQQGQAHVNYAELQRRMANLDLDLASLQDSMLKDFSEQLQTLQNAAQKQDFKQIHFCTHRMRGSALYLCYERLVELTHILDQFESIDTRFQECLGHIQEEIELLKSISLTEALKTHSNTQT